MILCLGSIADDTFWAGVSALARCGLPFDVVDIAEMCIDGRIDGRLDALADVRLELNDRERRLGDYAGIWTRPTGLSSAAPSAELEARAASVEGVLRAILRAASPFMPVVNAPPLDHSNFTKVFHLVASSGGRPWKVPRSCLTNDPDDATDFVARCPDGAIFKGASSTKTWASRFDPKQDVGRLSSLRNCPALFQEEIVGPDVRVHVVGPKTFAEQVISSEIDYRVVDGNSYTEVSLPVWIGDACVALCAEMGLPLAGIDFKVQKATGEWFFLEANSLPCFEGYDRRAGGAIGKAIAALFEAALERGPFRQQQIAIWGPSRYC